MTKEEHEKRLQKDVKEKIEELNFALYQGDVKQLLIFCMDKNGAIQCMRAFDSIGAPHFYLMSGILQKEIEEIFLKHVIGPMKSRE